MLKFILKKLGQLPPDGIRFLLVIGICIFGLFGMMFSPDMFEGKYSRPALGTENTVNESEITHILMFKEEEATVYLDNPNLIFLFQVDVNTRAITEVVTTGNSVVYRLDPFHLTAITEGVSHITVKANGPNKTTLSDTITVNVQPARTNRMKPNS
jgi:hypothetical protein